MLMEYDMFSIIVINWKKLKVLQTFLACWQDFKNI